MAARISLKHDETARRNIQTSQLLNRLASHVNGEVELTSTQVKAAEVLLRKSLPDLASMTLAGDPENPLETVIRWANSQEATPDPSKKS